MNQNAYNDFWRYDIRKDSWEIVKSEEGPGYRMTPFTWVTEEGLWL